LTPGPASWI